MAVNTAFIVAFYFGPVSVHRLRMKLFYLVAAAFAEEPPKGKPYTAVYSHTCWSEAEANVQFGNLYNSVGWETLFNSISDSTQNAIISPLAIMGSIFMLAESADEASKTEIYDVFASNLDEGTDPLNGKGQRRILR